MAGAGLAGRIALVTGAGRGIGRGIAEQLALAGAAVAVNDLDPATAADTAAWLRRSGATAHDVPGDVADEAAVDRIFAAIETAFGATAELLVNNAGIPGTGYHFLDLPAARWDELIRVNLRGTFLPAQRLARALVAARRPGAIVNIGSVQGDRAYFDNVPYDATKSGIAGATRAMALDLAPHRIRVNAVCPGFTRTERWSALSEATAAQRRAMIPLGQEATPEDIGRAAVFLLSADAANITGQTLYVDGGLTAQLHPRLPE